MAVIIHNGQYRYQDFVAGGGGYFVFPDHSGHDTAGRNDTREFFEFLPVESTSGNLSEIYGKTLWQLRIIIWLVPNKPF